LINAFDLVKKRSAQGPDLVTGERPQGPDLITRACAPIKASESEQYAYNADFHTQPTVAPRARFRHSDNRSTRQRDSV